MTRILDLPRISTTATVGTNEDWNDGWPYLDAAGAPISLAGITLVMMMRPAPDDPNVVICAATASGSIGGLPQNGLIVTGGDGLNILSLSIPESTMERVPPGAAYVAEVRAMAEGAKRVIARLVVTVVKGIVR